MKKFLTIISFGALLFAGSLIAETDYPSQTVLGRLERRIRHAFNPNDQVTNISSTVAFTLDDVTAYDFEAVSNVVLTASSLAPTNTQILSFTSPFVRLSPTLASTNTLADPGAGWLGREVTIGVVGTNSASFADGANLQLSAAYTMGTNDLLTLIGIQTNLWAEKSRSNN